jgi:uncharacterized protein
MDDEFYAKLKERIMRYFEGVNPTHDFMHTERVLNIALNIAEDENVDMDVLRMAVLLHDIGRKEQDESCGEICHAENGAKIARKILREFGVDEVKINKICHCIETHRTRRDKAPESIEAKILFDADKIDGLGAIGVLRTASFAGHLGAVVHNPEIDVEKTKAYSKDDSAYREFLVTHKNIIDKIMTKKGKEIAQKRDRFMKDFFERANKEAAGEV